MSDYTIKCRDCKYGEGTEKTEWVWCAHRRRAKLVHKDGSCGAGERRKDERADKDHDDA